MAMTRRGFLGALAGLAATLGIVGKPSPPHYNLEHIGDSAATGKRVRVLLATPSQQPMYPAHGFWTVGDKILFSDGKEATCTKTVNDQLAQAWIPHADGWDGTLIAFRHSAGIG
jgi:hypothetical protein